MTTEAISALQRRVTALEELLSHQEHLLQQLNQVVRQQQRDMEGLRQRVEPRLARLESLAESQSTPLDPDEKPPHY